MKIIILQVGFAAIDETVEYDFAININIVVRDEIAADLLRWRRLAYETRLVR